jgi:hypothetical protein
MKTRSSALYRRTARYHRGGGNSWLAASVSVGFALLPLGVMLWAVPLTGLGFA